MKSLHYAIFLILTLTLSACDNEGTFSGNPGGGPGLGGGGGPGGGGGGGIGGGGGVTTEPNMQYGPDEVVGFGAVKISGDAGEIIFVDEGDPLGENPSGDWQLFTYFIGSGNVVQITDGTAGAVPALFDFDVSGDGSEVVWVSSNDFAMANPNNRPQVFIAPTAGGSISQVTSFDTQSAFNPRVSGSGNVIAFMSADDLTGDNAALDDHIFTINADGSNLNQVLNQALAPQNMVISDDGSVIAFEAFGDPFGSNADNSLEIFTVLFDGTGLTQVTASAGDSFNPILSDDGSKVMFASRAEVVAGGNADGNYEVYVAQTDGSTITQISNGPDDSGTFASGAPGAFDLSGNGNWVVFTSESNLTGDNASLEHTIFTASADGGQIQQSLRDGTVAVDASQRRADQPTITNDGAGMAFESDVNLTSFTQPGFDKIYTTIRQ